MLDVIILRVFIALWVLVFWIALAFLIGGCSANVVSSNPVCLARCEATATSSKGVK